MTYRPLYIESTSQRRGEGARRQVFGVNDIEIFMLHRAPIKEIHRDERIDVEIIFEPKARFIPVHGIFQLSDCPRRVIQIATVNVLF